MSFNASMEDGISKRLAVLNSTLESNGALLGGAIFGGDGLQAVSLDILQVKSNLGGYGGAICLMGKPDVNITSCEFSFNKGNTTPHTAQELGCKHHVVVFCSSSGISDACLWHM